MAENYYYLLIDIATIAFPLAWTLDERIDFSSGLIALFKGIIFANLIFLPWDVLFTTKGIWGFNHTFLLGYNFLGLPVEEWLWFFVTPYACYFIYASLAYFQKKRKFGNYKILHFALAGILVIVGLMNVNHAYTSLTFILTAMALMVGVFVFKNYRWWYFWITYLICLIPFIIFNGALTGAYTPEPVVWYNRTGNLGIRLITIPLEDSVYLMLYLLLIFFFYGKYDLEKSQK
ncbi:MAG: lycopene cyclase domain-containing protein [Bacteroidetes bacterium]|nr:lycopene cyclase domain-containing protein [Bacteroidota bacterium]